MYLFFLQFVKHLFSFLICVFWILNLEWNILQLFYVDTQCDYLIIQIMCFRDLSIIQFLFHRASSSLRLLTINAKRCEFYLPQLNSIVTPVCILETPSDLSPSQTARWPALWMHLDGVHGREGSVHKTTSGNRWNCSRSDVGSKSMWVFRDGQSVGTSTSPISLHFHSYALRSAFSATRWKDKPKGIYFSRRNK